MQITIDSNAGFCFGVKEAIEAAEKEIDAGNEIYSLSELVHNKEEIDRLYSKGLKTISHQNLKEISGKTLLFRAHGEPPETYRQLKEKEIKLIDATCPVVLKLQNRVRKSYLKMKELDGNVLIFGKKGHAEVVGIAGQTNGEALVISNLDDFNHIDFSKPVEVFSQTTMCVEDYNIITSEIRKMCLQKGQDHCVIHQTICAQVSRRVPALKKLASENDAILFVSGKNSSNGKYLFNIAKEINPASYWIESKHDIDIEWFKNVNSVGISGATSTPIWQLEEVSSFVMNLKM
jgi:4-hydroxy-3-methylbut-2-en-1-yl diphosphate reductase